MYHIEYYPKQLSKNPSFLKKHGVDSQDYDIALWNKSTWLLNYFSNRKIETQLENTNDHSDFFYGILVSDHSNLFSTMTGFLFDCSVHYLEFLTLYVDDDTILDDFKDKNLRAMLEKSIENSNNCFLSATSHNYYKNKTVSFLDTAKYFVNNTVENLNQFFTIKVDKRQPSNTKLNTILKVSRYRFLSSCKKRKKAIIKSIEDNFVLRYSTALTPKEKLNGVGKYYYKVFKSMEYFQEHGKYISINQWDAKCPKVETHNTYVFDTNIKCLENDKVSIKKNYEDFVNELFNDPSFFMIYKAYQNTVELNKSYRLNNSIAYFERSDTKRMLLLSRSMKYIDDQDIDKAIVYINSIQFKRMVITNKHFNKRIQKETTEFKKFFSNFNTEIIVQNQFKTKDKLVIHFKVDDITLPSTSKRLNEKSKIFSILDRLSTKEEERRFHCTLNDVLEYIYYLHNNSSASMKKLLNHGDSTALREQLEKYSKSVKLRTNAELHLSLETLELKDYRFLKLIGVPITKITASVYDLDRLNEILNN